MEKGRRPESSVACRGQQGEENLFLELRAQDTLECDVSASASALCVSLCICVREASDEPFSSASGYEKKNLIIIIITSN